MVVEEKVIAPWGVKGWTRLEITGRVMTESLDSPEFGVGTYPGGCLLSPITMPMPMERMARLNCLPNQDMSLKIGGMKWRRNLDHPHEMMIEIGMEVKPQITVVSKDTKG